MEEPDHQRCFLPRPAVSYGGSSGSVISDLSHVLGKARSDQRAFLRLLSRSGGRPPLSPSLQYLAVRTCVRKSVAAGILLVNTISADRPPGLGTSRSGASTRAALGVLVLYGSHVRCQVPDDPASRVSASDVTHYRTSELTADFPLTWKPAIRTGYASFADAGSPKRNWPS